ncbi:hypothetical protein I5G59_gp92 [Mycobacterium phage LilMcDreamy]|uniref:Uncharacterized protein n=1 Tax=Mycobacterium phage LilMcDreamy TaxID=2652422 RepID=A0A5P8D8F1_9CAUD|nr:hypothetical protein I5G59_gp92 [Mycobacterium phage LilMcDreamy]QFP94712.1 hypothetical protein SEA_LILMCDREAMY_92 [Mycobacterium phage LilMcDreamy]
MASIEYTATAPNGESFTRTSPSMAYVAVLMVADADPGTENWGPYSWHKSYEAANAAAQASYHQGLHRTVVVDAIPTAVKGKASIGDFAGHPRANVIDDLIEAKAAKPRKGKKADVAEIEAEAPEAVADEFSTEVDLGLGEMTDDERAEVEALVVPEPVAEDVTEVAEKPAKAKAPKAKKPVVPTERTLKQQLGAAVVEAAMAAALANVPEGMTADEATEIVTKWMSYIPVPKQA